MIGVLTCLAVLSGPSTPDAFDAWLALPYAAANGFDVPGNDGSALADGRVIGTKDGVVTVEHVFYENHEKRTVRSLYRNTDGPPLKPGDNVTRGQRIGGTSALFASDGRPIPRLPAQLFVPQREKVLVLVDSSRARMRILIDGKRSGDDLQIGFGQVAGCKVRQGDLKTPCGMYFVTGKSTGPFGGDYAAYYGGHFIKLNYPNPYDGERRGLATEDQRKRIRSAWAKRELTPQNTRLGGGIGFHGWAEEWPETDSMRGSWGCITAHNRDIAAVYERIPIGAMVVLW